MAVVVELVPVDRLEPDPGLPQRLLDLGLVLPDERDRDAAVRAYLARAGDEPRRQPGPLEHTFRAHGVLRGVEGDDPAPLQARFLTGSAVLARRATTRSASIATSRSRSVVSKPHERRRVPSGAVPSERWAAGEQWSPARVITPHSSSRSRAAVAQGMPSRFTDAIPTAPAGSSRPWRVSPATPASPSRNRRPSAIERAWRRSIPASARYPAAAPRPTMPIAFRVPLS